MKNHKIVCRNCGNEFTSSRKDTRYCSNSCRVQASNIRKQENLTDKTSIILEVDEECRESMEDELAEFKEDDTLEEKLIYLDLNYTYEIEQVRKKLTKELTAKITKEVTEIFSQSFKEQFHK